MKKRHKWVLAGRRQNRYMYKREDVNARLGIEKNKNPNTDWFILEYFLDEEKRRRIFTAGDFSNDACEFGLLEGTSAMVDVWKEMHG